MKKGWSGYSWVLLYVIEGEVGGGGVEGDRIETRELVCLRAL